MVARLEHRGGQVRFPFHQVVFRVLLHVPGEQKAGRAIGDFQYNGGVVGLIIRLDRTQNLHLGSPQGEGVPRLRNLDAAVRLGVIGEV